MATDNNNSERLADRSDDDPTEEFEIPSPDSISARLREPEIEADADTFNFEEHQSAGDPLSGSPTHAVAADQSRRIEELEFELESLSCRHRSLNHELEAREDIARELADQLQAALSGQQALEQQLQDRSSELDTLRIALDRGNERIAELERRHESLKEWTSASKNQIESLTQQLVVQDRTIAGLTAELEVKAENAAKALAGKANKEVAALKENLLRAETELSELRSYVCVRKAQWELRNSELGKLRTQLETSSQNEQAIREKLRSLEKKQSDYAELLSRSEKQLKDEIAEKRRLARDNRQLRKRLDTEAGRELDRVNRRNADQAGEISRLKENLTKVERDNDRFERYADQLRIELQDQIAVAKISVAIRKSLESSLEMADDKICALAADLENATQAIAKLQQPRDKSESNDEQRLSDVAGQIGVERELHEGEVKQLKSELREHRTFRDAIESQLTDPEKNGDQIVRMLRDMLAGPIEDRPDGDERAKYEESATEELTDETEHRDRGESSSSDSDNALVGIDGFGVETGRYGFAGDRDKVARLLIGNADGRELRFPLFKDRLTIGRTSNNDIQLNMQFISRRHAVVATDNGVTRIIDWGSKNGIYVNQSRVSERILRSGDIVTIGTTEFRYEEKPKR